MSIPTEARGNEVRSPDNERGSGPRLARLLTLRAGLKLEKLGMRRSKGPSAYTMIKREFGFRGTREAVYTQFCEYVEKQR